MSSAGRRGVGTSGTEHQEGAARDMAWTDEELVTRSASGDTESFNQLVVRWERPIYALAYRVLGREEDARDVCQEAFLRAFRALKGFRGQAKFSSWLYRITLNLCHDWMRRERRAPLTQVPDAVDLADHAAGDTPAESIEDLVVRRDLGRAVSKAMLELSPEQRTAIILKEYHGLIFPGDCRSPRLSAEHGQDPSVSRIECVTSAFGAQRRVRCVAVLSERRVSMPRP